MLHFFFFFCQHDDPRGVGDNRFFVPPPESGGGGGGGGGVAQKSNVTTADLLKLGEAVRKGEAEKVEEFVANNGVDALRAR